MTNIKMPTIADIQTSDLFFYDPELTTCYQFCLERDIDCLPALDDPNKIFLRDDNIKKFIEVKISADRKISGNTGIFDQSMLKRFQNHHLLMVYNQDDLTGVVHFCDYNNPVVSAFLYDLFYQYEKALRKFLISKDMSNANMISFFNYMEEKKKKLKDLKVYEDKLCDYQKKGSKKNVPQFEVFYLTDLIALINHNKLIKLNNPSELRNMVMHANDFIHTKDPSSDDYVFDFTPFEKFFELVLKLILDFRTVSNRLNFPN
jgi:hypothetical protein